MKFVKEGDIPMNKQRIGEKLKELRGDRPKEEICIAAGISTSALTMYELGQRIPRDEIKEALARIYKTSVQELFYS